jgi:sigma-B regulation protein RsbU (phosphoserine phosphatase)
LAIVILALSFSTSALKQATNSTTVLTRHGIEKLVAGNNHFSQELLTDFGEQIVEMKAKLSAYRIKLQLERLKWKSSYEVLRSNKVIRQIATARIIIPNSDGEDEIAGYIDMLDNHGMAVIHPNKEVEGKNYSQWKNEYPDMYKLVLKSFNHDFVSGYYNFLDENKQSVKKFMALAKVSGTNLIICASVEINKYFIPFQKKVVILADHRKNEIEQKLDVLTEKILIKTYFYEIIGGAILLVIGAFLALWQANAIASPIQKFCSDVHKLGHGDFSLNIPETGTEEIIALKKAFNSLSCELAEYVKNLKKETTARQAIETEIAITRQIQEALIPHTFPPYPDRNEFQLYANLIPAKEVSGDFYDFFFVDDNKIALIIADVSGKGLPASLFMAVSRTLIRNLCLNANVKSPSDILNRANNYLCENNETCMFVTAFLAFYDISTGVLTYSNAGHNEIISWNDSGNCKLFGAFANPPLGVLEDYNFSEEHYELPVNETVIFFTDGITEALNPEKELYGMERFLDLLKNQDYTISLNDITDKLNAHLDDFQQGKQFDDITIMLFRRNQ